MACLVLLRRFVASREWGWVAYCAATAVAAAVLSPLGGNEGLSIRLALGAMATCAWVTVVALRLRREVTPRSARPA